MYITRWMGKKKLSKFLLAPCELESILLLANCLLLIGKTDEAMQMHKKVADYVKQAKFEPKGSDIDLSTGGISWNETRIVCRQ